MVKLSAELQALYDSWGDGVPMKKWMNDMQAMLLENMLRGERVPKDRIPKFYLFKYGARNLYHYTHPEDYRSSYTILNDGTGAYPLVIDLLNHHDYNKLFNYD